MADAMMKHLTWKLWWASRQGFLYPGLYFCHKGNRRILPIPKAPAPPALIDFKEQTVTYAKDQPEYRPLPAYKYKDDPQGKIVCCWKLSLRDRIKVLMTGKVWHLILTFNHPLQPQLMMVDKPEMPSVPNGPS